MHIPTHMYIYTRKYIRTRTNIPTKYIHKTPKNKLSENDVKTNKNKNLIKCHTVELTKHK